ncbi:MAG: peptide deformylase, partial [Armatimonadetes bacterium]|nr:peptide deformylase [Armatimonadota bacterium]
GVGLAAPQIGASLRVIVWDVGEGVGALINPKITRRSGSQIGPEGCLSIPGLQGEVARPDRVTVRGLDRSGNEVRITGEGLLARCLCHEVDHLDGVLFVDRAHESTLRWVASTEEDDLQAELAERQAEAPEEEARRPMRVRG